MGCKEKARRAGYGLGLGFPERATSNSKCDIILNTDLIESLGDMTVIWLAGLQISSVKTKTFRPAQGFSRWIYPDIFAVMRFLFRLFFHRTTS